MAAPTFCDAVLNALGRDSYPADCATADCPQRCAFPDASGNCPPSAVTIAQKTDLLRRSDGPAREVVLAQLADAGAELWQQYRVNASSVTWEDIADQCRLPSGHKRSRDDLASLGYNYRSRPLFFRRENVSTTTDSGSGAAATTVSSGAHAWLDQLENYPVNADGKTIAAAIDPLVPLIADRLLPPVLTFIIAALFILILVVILVVAMRRLSQPDREIVVLPATRTII